MREILQDEWDFIIQRRKGKVFQKENLEVCEYRVLGIWDVGYL